MMGISRIAKASLLLALHCQGIAGFTSSGIRTFSSLSSAKGSVNRNGINIGISNPFIHGPSTLPNTAFAHQRTALSAESADGPANSDTFDLRTTVGLIAGQSALIGVAVALAAVLHTPNFGFGPNIQLTASAVLQGVVCTLPLGLLAFVLDKVEPHVPALQQVTMATQRSVMAVLGTRWKPRTALLASTALGMAAGFGEEMLFRGVLQYELGASFAAVGWTSVLFGLLHAVTPLYAVLATLASLYFGWLYLAADNLVVPILTHGLYDVAALMYAHYTVSKLSPQEQLEIAEWRGPGDPEEKEEKSS